MKSKRHRLHIGKLTSIGAVVAGDNPEADVLLWKSAPEAGPRSRTGATAKAAEGAGGTGSPFTPTVVEYLEKRISRATRALTGIADSHTQMRGQIGMGRTAKPEGRSSAAVLAQVDQLASNIQKSGGVSKSQSRAEVWRVHPELKDEVRRAQARERSVGKTIATDIDRIVKSYCMSISTEPENRTRTLSQIRNEVMHSAVGLEIKQLRDAARDGKVGSETEILKSADYADAWSALKKWDAGTVG